MITKAKLSLERAIDKWVEEIAEDYESRELFYYHPEVVEQMAKAAEIVFDTMVASSAYTIKETKV